MLINKMKVVSRSLRNGRIHFLGTDCHDARSELHLFEKADHAQSIVVDRARYEAILLDFLKKCGVTE